MKKHAILLLFVLPFFGLIAAARADSLTLVDGTNLIGAWAGFSNGQISFLIDGTVRTYSKSDVSKVTFGGPSAAVKLGQTVDEVTAALGAPKTTQESGTTKIYIYPALKITFTDGKVSKVE
jgi:hypothetical protein